MGERKEKLLNIATWRREVQNEAETLWLESPGFYLPSIQMLSCY